MTKERKVALLLAGTLFLGAATAGLKAFGQKEEPKEEKNTVSVSETSIDTKDIVIIDTYNSKVVSRGINERYLILYRVGVQHDEDLDLPNNTSTSYIYRDIADSNYIGIFTEYEDNGTIFVYSHKDLIDTSRSILVEKTLDKSWYGNLNSEKIAFEFEELLEMYNELNKNYINDDDTTTYNKNEKLSYTFTLGL